MIQRIVIRRDTTANWSLYNPILASGEFGLDQTNDDIKMGDGVTPWLSLPKITLSAQELQDLINQSTIGLATEPKQDDIIQNQAIQITHQETQVEKQTEQLEHQATLNDLIEAMYEMTRMMGFPQTAKLPGGEIRVQTNGGSISTIANISGSLNDQTSIGSRRAEPMVPSAMNQTAIFSNINNIVVT